MCKISGGEGESNDSLFSSGSISLLWNCVCSYKLTYTHVCGSVCPSASEETSCFCSGSLIWYQLMMILCLALTHRPFLKASLPAKMRLPFQWQQPINNSSCHLTLRRWYSKQTSVEEERITENEFCMGVKCIIVSAPGFCIEGEKLPLLLLLLPCPACVQTSFTWPEKIYRL